MYPVAPVRKTVIAAESDKTLKCIYGVEVSSA